MSDTSSNDDREPHAPDYPGSTDEDVAAQQKEAILKEGRFAAMESDDNAIASSDDAFFGVSDEYKEYAHPNFEPLVAEEGPEKEIEERIAAANEELAAQATTGDTRFGYNPRVVHPSVARQPSADLIDQNRKIMEKAAGGKAK